MLVKILALGAIALAAYVIFVMLADARDPYGTPDAEVESDAVTGAHS
jgi:hypothetical protein